MRVITSAAGMQRLALRWRRAGTRVGLVPTMGYLHAGHISLVRRARQLAGRTGTVVVSIYVNPAQFGPQEDFRRYPRDLQRDQQLCRAAGVDVIFAPPDAEMYPRSYSTYVAEEKLSNCMEGRSRPGHFRGVTTIVAKLFNLVLPSVAVFGAKDYQQAAIIQRMARDLNFPLKVIVALTRREPDGLAMSSRNKYLTGALRTQAAALWQAIQTARAEAKKPSRVSAATLRRKLQAFIERQPAARVDYIEFFDPVTLEPADWVGPGVHLALAVFVGPTRLIDNASL
jgi:pantoate--beta-alanine ligase